MKKTDQHHDDFDKEMQNDPIVKLYKEVWVSPEEESRLDARFDETYRRVIQQGSKQDSRLPNWIQTIFNFNKPAANWAIPASLTIGIVTGVISTSIFLHVVSSDTELEHRTVSVDQLSPAQVAQARPSIDKWLENRETPIYESKRSFLAGRTKQSNDDEKKRSPEDWLRDIVILVYEGKITQAEEELKNFTSLYPNYQKIND